ncbi:MAG: substrate-binding domain-containing protein [Eubacteriales bacterium]
MKKNKSKKLELKLALVIVMVLIVIMIILLIFKQKIGAVSSELTQEDMRYDKYYVLIADESDDVLWESVYAGAVQAGMEENIYVEMIQEGDGIEYTLQEKMRIAIDSKVDGIILSADGEEETTLLINEAVEKNISVVTALNDDTQSLKQCFVGVNDYSFGEEYGKLIWECILKNEEEQDTYTVSVLMDSSNTDTGKNTTYLGIKEYLETQSKLEEVAFEVIIKTVAMDRSDTFSSEETIRDIIFDGTTDIIVCLNSTDTDAAYRSVVDYNEVGSLEIIGYYETKDILEAIDKKIIEASITIDGGEVGSQCVRALLEYQETGFVSGYFSVNTYVLNQDNVAEYLRIYEEESEDEDE